MTLNLSPDTGFTSKDNFRIWKRDFVKDESGTLYQVLPELNLLDGYYLYNATTDTKIHLTYEVAKTLRVCGYVARLDETHKLTPEELEKLQNRGGGVDSEGNIGDDEKFSVKEEV